MAAIHVEGLRKESSRKTAAGKVSVSAAAKAMAEKRKNTAAGKTASANTARSGRQLRVNRADGIM